MGRSKVVMWMWYNICGTTATLKTESKADLRYDLVNLNSPEKVQSST